MSYPDKSSYTPPKMTNGSGAARLIDLSFISSAILYVCMTVCLGIYVKSCQLTAETIEECRHACSEWGSRLDTVTSTKCECASREDFIEEVKPEDIWVLPKGN